MTNKDNFSITNTTRGKIPLVSFSDIKRKVLGEKYNLSVVFVGNKKSQELNKTYRGKDKPTNCLSFNLDKNSPASPHETTRSGAGWGEIFINLQLARKEATNFDKKFDDFVAYLFIHSCLHLKGMEHSSTMEKKEMEILKFFGI